MLLSQMLVYQNESNVYTKYNNTGCLKKRNLLKLEYLKDASVKLIVLLVCYLPLPYKSIKLNFSFL